MARLKITGFDELVKEMEERGEKTGQVADAMLFSAAEVAREAWRESAQSHGHKDTGQLIASIGYQRKIKEIGGAKNIDVYPQGKDHKGVRNAEKAFILHYGTSRRTASHWVDDANAAAEPKIATTMRGIWEEYIRTGKVPEVTKTSYAKEKKAAKEYALTKYHGEGRSEARGAANRRRAEDRRALKNLLKYTKY